MTESSYQRYLAVPSSKQGAGVLVLHAWWGLTDFVRQTCDRLAQEGYVALAPDLYSGKLARTIKEAEQIKSKFDEEHEVPPIVQSAVKELSQRSTNAGKGLAVIGFSMGAFWSLWLAQEQPELFRAVTLFYGTNGGGGDFRLSQAAFLGHFAESDPYESIQDIRTLEANLKSANRPTTFYIYPGTSHWFVETDRPDAYNAQAAELAWERTFTFLRDRLGS